ncbi:glutathione peroxidase [Balneicella halophila]|uniref:Glutathione peroxidase n=2 Tax=Balneicella halophila TaxID=1537566 RepID=A0A7L4UPS5_BALHA|nr:glutathione peroxidase [Balneicella halophila]
MKKIIIYTILGLLALACGKKMNNTEAIKDGDGVSIYHTDFNIKTLSGESFDLKSLKGKKVMIVNTASKCGLTPQYEKLEALYQKYNAKGLVIIGFPANNFMSQEPGTNEEIATFCKQNYGVTFPMMSKISVKGDDMHPLYQFLTQKEKNGVSDSEVAWNFQKYLIDENGFIQFVIPPTTEPDDEEIINWIEG